MPGLPTGRDQLLPIGWAVATGDHRRTAARLREAGFDPGEPVPGRRRQPDGSTLEWTMFWLAGRKLGPRPFFIEWGTRSEHPATRAPAGCRLQELTLSDPDVAGLRRLLEILELAPIGVGKGAPALRLTLATPAGYVTFGEAPRRAVTAGGQPRGSR